MQLSFEKYAFVTQNVNYKNCTLCWLWAHGDNDQDFQEKTGFLIPRYPCVIAAHISPKRNASAGRQEMVTAHAAPQPLKKIAPVLGDPHSMIPLL